MNSDTRWGSGTCQKAPGTSWPTENIQDVILRPRVFLDT